MRIKNYGDSGISRVNASLFAALLCTAAGVSCFERGMCFLNIGGLRERRLTGLRWRCSQPPRRRFTQQGRSGLLGGESVPVRRMRATAAANE